MPPLRLGQGKAFSLASSFETSQLGRLVWKRCRGPGAELCWDGVRREEAEPQPWHGPEEPCWERTCPTSPYLMEAPPKQRGGLAKLLIESLSLFQLTVLMNLFPLTSSLQQRLVPHCKTTLYDQLCPAQGLGPTSYSLVFRQKDPFLGISHSQTAQHHLSSFKSLLKWAAEHRDHLLASTWAKARKMQSLCLKPEKQDSTVLCIQGRTFTAAWGITLAPQFRFFLGQVSLPSLPEVEHSWGWAAGPVSCRSQTGS